MSLSRLNPRFAREAIFTTMSSEKYKNSPIKEAACELRIVAGSPWDLAVPGLVYERLKGRFPKRRQEKTISATVVGAALTTLEMERLQFLRDDEKALVSISKDVFVVSSLQPYLEWEHYRPLILDSFKTYSEITSPAGFQRLGLRYINQIDFKQDKVLLEDFFEFYPFVGKRLPQDHGTFVVGVEMPFSAGRDNLRLQLATAAPASGYKLSINLDLDYFLLDPAKVGLVDLENWLEEAHSTIAKVFEGCITDNLRRRFRGTD